MARSDLITAFRDSLPFSGLHVRGFTGENSRLAQYLAASNFDYEVLDDDFTGDTLDTNVWTTGLDVTTATGAKVSNSALGSVVALASGATDEEAGSLYGDRQWMGDKNALMLARVQFSDITDVQFEIGLIDAASDKTLPIITDIDTPASGNGAADLAVFHMDTSQTLTTAAVVTDGSTANYNCTKTSVTVGGSAWTPTADTWYWFMVGLKGDMSVFRIFNTSGGKIFEKVHGTTTASKVEGGTRLMPWLFIRTKEAADRQMIIDRVRVMQERAA